MSSLTPDEWEAVTAEFAASQARNDALTSKRRFEAGEFSIELLRGSDDPPEDDPAFQAELGEFLRSFRAAGVIVTQEGVAFDALDGGGYALAVFLVKSLGLPVVGAAAHVCATWLRVRADRRLRLKAGDVVAEGATIEEIERLMKIGAEFCAATRKNGGKR